jgi:hypothetical protein
MNLSLKGRFTLSPDVLFQEVGGDLVLLDLASEQYFGLDEVGARIWQLLADGASVGEVLDTLLLEYDVRPARLESDVSTLLEELSGAGLLRPADEDT